MIRHPIIAALRNMAANKLPSAIVRWVNISAACIVLSVTSVALAQNTEPRPPRVQPAIDGIMAAFATHPLVGLEDNHGLAQEEDFYAAVIRDPRFARDVGNVVVEFGGAAAQSIIDRYVNGENVPYVELRKVWTQVVGWNTDTGLGYKNFYAQVRAVNLTLPPERRIHVWLGEPEIDWASIKTQADIGPIMQTRDSHAADVIKREILAKKKKALVIYGGAHLSRSTMSPVLPVPQIAPAPPQPKGANSRADNPPPRAIVGNVFSLVEQEYPKSFFVVHPYTGYAEKSCSEIMEKTFQSWPTPALATPLRDGALANQLMQKNCHFSPQGAAAFFSSGPGPGLTPEQQAQVALMLDRAQQDAERSSSGIDSDALLYLGSAASLTRTPTDPDIYLDEDYRAEINRRLQLEMIGQPLGPVKLEDHSVSPRMWRQY